MLYIYYLVCFRRTRWWASTKNTDGIRFADILLDCVAEVLPMMNTLSSPDCHSNNSEFTRICIACVEIYFFQLDGQRAKTWLRQQWNHLLPCGQRWSFFCQHKSDLYPVRTNAYPARNCKSAVFIWNYYIYVLIRHPMKISYFCTHTHINKLINTYIHKFINTFMNK